VVLAEQGRHEEGLAEVLKEPADWARLTGLAYVNYLAGRRRESDDALRELTEKHGDTSAYQVALIHATRGEVDAAFHWLDRSVEDKDTGTAMMFSEPRFRPIHGDPRWRLLLRRIGLDA